MPYASLENLSRFHGRLKGYALENFAGMDMANWQKTETAGAVAFHPAPEMPLEPVVNFMFTETGPASGTKGPDNPSTIAGVTEAKVTRCGKNLLQPRAGIATQTINGVTFTVNGDGSYTANGTATGNADFYLLFSSSGFPSKAGLAYTLSGCPSGGSVETYQLRSYIFSFNAVDTGSGATFVSPSTGTVNCFIRINSGTTVSNLVFKPQIELGTAATSFEPYEGADYTVNLNGTYYGGSVDLSTGVMTVTWFGTKLTSVSSFRGPFDIAQSGSNKRYIANLPYGAAPYTATNQACTHYNYSHLFDDNIQQAWVSASGSCYIYDSFATLAELNAFLDFQNSNGTPVVICYQLATPFTVPLTPLQIYSLFQLDLYTPRINTVYSDQVSVQVGYPKSPQATQNELTNAVVSLGGNV